MNEFLRAAIEEAELGLGGGGIPIGSVVEHGGRILGRGHDRRVQQGSVIRHGEALAILTRVSFLINFVRQLNRMLGPGTLVNLLLSRYHRALRVDERRR